MKTLGSCSFVPDTSGVFPSPSIWWGAGMLLFYKTQPPLSVFWASAYWPSQLRDPYCWTTEP